MENCTYEVDAPCDASRLSRHARLASAAIGLGVALCFYGTAAATDIALFGFNRDVVYAGGSDTAVGFDGVGNYWIADGIQQTYTGGTVTAVGLPVSRSFTSETGSGVVYHLQPYDQNNVLHMGTDLYNRTVDPDAGVIGVTPNQYTTLHVLAGSGTYGPLPYGYPYTSDITLNFADGSVTLPNALLGYDWYTPATTAPTGTIAISGLNRDYLGNYLDTRLGFGLYETTLDLTVAGLSSRILQSVTFNNVEPDEGDTSIFAIDGVAVPEPGSLSIAAVGLLGLLARRRRPA